MSLLLTFRDPAGKINLLPRYFLDNFSLRSFVYAVTGWAEIISSSSAAQPVFINSLIASCVGRSCVRNGSSC